MTQSKISSKQYEASIACARKKAGDDEQSCWKSHLKAAAVRPAKAAKKPTTR
jgi:hypothetical protein